MFDNGTPECFPKPVGVGKGHSYPAGTTDYAARKAYRAAVAEGEYTAHGYKHLKASTEAEAMAFSRRGSAAQYLPDVSNAGLEKIALQKGFVVEHGRGLLCLCRVRPSDRLQQRRINQLDQGRTQRRSVSWTPSFGERVAPGGAGPFRALTGEHPTIKVVFKMELTKVKTPGLEKASIKTSGAWKILHHRFFQVSPEDADKMEIEEKGWTVWNLCFLEDLLQVVNSSAGLLLDVGWYPDSDPSGTYRLQLVRVHEEGKEGHASYDWHNPVVDFRTRCLDELLAEIHRIVGDDTRAQDSVPVTPPVL